MIITQKKNTFVGLQIAWCLSTVMAIVRKTWKFICSEQWRNNFDSINLTFSSAVWLVSEPMQNMEYDIARLIVKSGN